jgi:plastocyanin
LHFKWWHPIAFSLVPLALVFIGVLGGAFRGVGSEAAPRPSPPPQVTPGPTEPRPTPAPGTAVLDLLAKDLAFDKRTLEVPAGAEVTIRFDNADPGILHNFALYTNQEAQEEVFVGDLTTGPVKVDFTFPAPAPGSYFFRCDVHPDQMTGTFIVR